MKKLQLHLQANGKYQVCGNSHNLDGRVTYATCKQGVSSDQIRAALAGIHLPYHCHNARRRRQQLIQKRLTDAGLR